MIADALGNPVAISLTPGQSSDLELAESLLEKVDPQVFLADKAYDADALISRLEEREITLVIPPKANRVASGQTDFLLYGERNLIERFFNNFKQFRAIATRFGKLTSTLPDAFQLAAALITLN